MITSKISYPVKIQYIPDLNGLENDFEPKKKVIVLLKYTSSLLRIILCYSDGSDIVLNYDTISKCLEAINMFKVCMPERFLIRDTATGYEYWNR